MAWFPPSFENWSRYDSNGDGIVGSRRQVLGSYYRNPGAYGASPWTASMEKLSGRDLNGDGFVGNPHAVAFAHRSGQNPYAMPSGPYGPPRPGFIPGPVPGPMPPYHPGFWGYMGHAVGFVAAPFALAANVVNTGLGIAKDIVSTGLGIVKSVFKKIF